MPTGEDKPHLLMDANELQAFYGAIESTDPANFIKDINVDDDYESTLAPRIVYGCYKPQPDQKFPRNEVIRHINDAINKWLAHINGNDVVYMGIDDIVVYDEPVLRKGCSHHTNSKSQIMDAIPFSALVSAPKEVVFGNKNTQAVTAFLRYFKQMDVASNLLNRMGLFAFKAEEKRFKKTITSDNWKNMIDQKRAISAAQAAI